MKCFGIVEEDTCIIKILEYISQIPLRIEFSVNRNPCLKPNSIFKEKKKVISVKLSSEFLNSGNHRMAEMKSRTQKKNGIIFSTLIVYRILYLESRS